MRATSVDSAKLPDAGEARRRSGATRRQLEHWMHIGLVWPAEPQSGRGRRARFSEADIAWITCVRELTDLGVEPARLRDAIHSVGVVAYSARLEAAAERVRRNVPSFLADSA